MTHKNPDIIIEGGLLLTMVEDQGFIEDARVLIKGDKISDILTSFDEERSFEGIETIDAKNCIIMPGLINSHCHSAMTLFRGYADDLPLKQWLFEKIFPAEAKYLSPDSVYWGSLLACLEMIASGTTSFIDGYFFQDETFRAAHQSGLRALIAQGVIDFPAPGISDPKKNLVVGREFLEKWTNFSDLITPGLFCHSLVTCSDNTLIQAKKISQEFGLPLQIHLSETLEEVEEVIKRTGQRPAQYLNELGLLGDDLIAAHSIHLNPDEIELLYKNNVKVVHVPESNMKLSSGVAKISDMIHKGIEIGIGTDGCASNNNLDMFQEMDTAAKIAKVMTLDPVNMPAESVLKMATLGGARMMGLEQEIGTIEKDKQADIIVIDVNSPHMVPLYNPISLVVYSASGADVKDVVVNGQILLKDRIFQTLDPDEIQDRVMSLSMQIRE